MLWQKPAPDLILGGYRFAGKNMRDAWTLEHVPIPYKGDML
jgi:hypothetical protein